MAEYRITVQDTGIGMDEEFQKHAFEAFERERTSTESKMEKAFIPIIAMPANAFEEDHKKAVQTGMDGFVIKLIKVDKLMQEIQLLYEKN